MKTGACSLLLTGWSVLLYGQTQLQDISSWAYQLQNIDIQAIADNTTFDLIVMDYSADGSDEARFEAAQIRQIKSSGKKAISYISIGEAEDYRFYWETGWDADRDGIPDAGAPAWLGNENRDWEGNYKVRFWQSGWQDIVFSYIDRIIDQGFDGIYCDIIDAYYYWSEENIEKTDADALMVRFIQNIRGHIEGKTSDPFYILPQNGEYIVAEDDVADILKQAYFEAIQGIGIEDIFFTRDSGETNLYDPDTGRIDILKDYLDAGIPVFSVEYLTESGLIQQYKTAAETEGYIPYVARRELDTLNDGIATRVTSPGKEPPRSFSLIRNHPNPFNGNTTILFTLTQASHVRLDIRNASGSVVCTLADEKRRAGDHALSWDGRNDGGHPLPSGLYFLSLQPQGSSPERRKILLTR